MVFWVAPSDHVTAHGPVPVRSAEMVVELPEQMVVEPLTVAVGPEAPNGETVVRLILSNCHLLPLLALPARSRTTLNEASLPPKLNEADEALHDSVWLKFGLTQSVRVLAVKSILAQTRAVVNVPMLVTLSAPVPFRLPDAVAPQFAACHRSPIRNFSVGPL